jgi:hypothetical protein
MADNENEPFVPPREVLYAFYALLVIVLIATLAIVGAYI